MNIIKQEWKLGIKSVAIWCIALSLVFLMFMSIFPSFSSDAATSKDLINSMPEQVRAALHINLDSFLSFMGFFAYILTYVGLACAIQAMNIGLLSLGRETTSGTSEFLMTKPVSRFKIFISKLIAAFSLVLLTDMVLIFAIILMIKAFGVQSNELQNIGYLAAALLMLQFMFLSLGVLMSQLIQKIKSVVTVSIGFVISFFALSVIVDISGDKFLRYLTPFQYFDHMNIINTGSFEGSFLGLSVFIVLAFLLVAMIIYMKRDARSAT